MPATGPSALIAAAELPQPGPGVGFAEVYTEHMAFVWRSLRRLGVSERDLDDVCQEVFVIVHRKYSRLAAARKQVERAVRRRQLGGVP